MTNAITNAILAKLNPQIESIFAKYSTSIIADIQKQHNDMSVEIRSVSEHLEKALAKIDMMIARSDARVESINHMVDNCLELSKTCSNATEKANETVLINCKTIQEDILLHKQTSEDYSTNMQYLQEHCNELHRLLVSEQSERMSLHESLTAIKHTVDILIGSSARPNININPKQ